MAFTNVLPGSGVYPDLLLEWAPTTKPTDAVQTYVDITSRLRDWQWGYGRNDELGQIEAGGGSITLSNSDRAFDANYSGGPWFGNIKPRKMFRLRAQWAGVTYPVFVAYARGFPLTYIDGNGDSVVKIQLVDAQAILQAYSLAVGFTRSVERVDVRIGAALDSINFPAALRALDVGTVDVDALTVTSDTSALAHVRDIAQNAEGAPFFFAKDGTATFHNYTRRLNAASRFTFSDVLGAAYPYGLDVEPVRDDNYLWNFASVSGVGSNTAAVAQNAASQLDYHPLTKVLSTQLVHGSDLEQMAGRIVAIYAQPLDRLPQLSLNGAMKPSSLWPAILGMEISDRITWQRQPLDANDAVIGSAMSLRMNVEGVRHVCKAGGPWTTVLPLSPADTRAYMVTDDATLGISDGSNVAA